MTARLDVDTDSSCELLSTAVRRQRRQRVVLSDSDPESPAHEPAAAGAAAMRLPAVQTSPARARTAAAAAAATQEALAAGAAAAPAPAALAATAAAAAPAMPMEIWSVWRGLRRGPATPPAAAGPAASSPASPAVDLCSPASPPAAEAAGSGTRSPIMPWRCTPPWQFSTARPPQRGAAEPARAGGISAAAPPRGRQRRGNPSARRPALARAPPRTGTMTNAPRAPTMHTGRRRRG